MSKPLVVLVERGAVRRAERVDVLAPRAAGRRGVEAVDVHARDDRDGQLVADRLGAARVAGQRPDDLQRRVGHGELVAVLVGDDHHAAVARADRDDRDPAAGALGGVGAPAEARGAVGALHVLAHRLDELVVVADRRQRLVLVRLRPRPARRGLRRGRRCGDGEHGERGGDRRGCAVLLHMAPLPRVDYFPTAPHSTLSSHERGVPPPRRARADRAGAAGRRGRLPGARGALPRRAARARLPDARLRPRRRGRDAGRAAARLARAPPLRRPQRAEVVAVPDRHQHLPGPDQEAPQEGAADRPRPARRRPRRAGRAADRVDLDRALSRRGRSRTAAPRPRRATSSARASSWRSSPRSSTCPRASARC